MPPGVLANHTRGILGGCITYTASTLPGEYGRTLSASTIGDRQLSRRDRRDPTAPLADPQAAPGPLHQTGLQSVRETH